MPGYLGDAEKKIAHNLASMKKECDIYDIKMENRKYFTPDTEENVKSSGFELCKYCN